MNTPTIIVTGLPASGKSSVARALATSLNVALFDKDDFLERLYDKHGVPDWATRKLLSRKSDKDFRAAAVQADGPVLVSHWRPRNATAETGTPTEWLKAAFHHIIEVYCNCPGQVAADRFLARKRHPGHMDAQRGPADIIEAMQLLSGGFPLGLGPIIEVNTEIDINVESVLLSLTQYTTDLG